MKIEGVAQLIARLQVAQKTSVAGAYAAARLAGEDLLARSLTVTPMDEGTLRQSGSVRTEGSMTGGNFSVIVGYDTPYAAAVHEMPPDNQWTTPGTGSKYLESPFAENQARYAAAIIQGAKKGLLGGTL